jgi:PAS domain S-box-containing protein
MTTLSSGEKTVGKCVVFADNDPILLEAIPEVLKAKGYDVHCAQDGLETLQVIRRLHPAFVILDIVMPKIDGSRVCWLVRQDAKLRNTPIIAFSALGPEQIGRFPELSADAYVAKGPLPVAANNLLAAMKYLEERGRGDLQGGIFGYEGFQSRRLVTEVLGLKRYWEALVRMVRDGILALDEDGRVLLVNPAASRLLGKKETIIIGAPLPALLAAKDRDAIQHALGELKNARLPADHQIELTLREQGVCLRLSNIMEDGACSGMLAILESKTPPAKGRIGADSS